MEKSISIPYRFIILSEDIEEVKKMRVYNNQVIPDKSTAIAVDTNEQFIFQDGKWRKMSIDELRQECKYCYREVDASGLEAFRCTNKTVNMETSWCRPKNANEPCSICEYCKPREEIGMTIDEAIKRYKGNAEYERTHGNLQGCLEFRQLVEWLSKYQKIKEIIDDCDLEAWEVLEKIKEVVEDGKID